MRQTSRFPNAKSITAKEVQEQYESYLSEK